ncbi:uracil-xanthine permease family protein [Filifactor villosus]|uniref:Uracil-xanthine permease family protein n=1 Tax=Filifactor villosus TaxID=29374 RepID=A0ABV9QPR4_9FIRM
MAENKAIVEQSFHIEGIKVGTIQKLILALQHLVAMFGATVLVPILTGLDISVGLVCAGIGTLIFHLCTKRKVPVFLGSSFAFIPVIIAVGEQYGDLRFAQGGIVVAGFVYVLISLLVKAVGVEKITKYFPSQVIGPMIMVIGFNLIPTAWSMASNNFAVAFITLGIAVAISQLGKGFFKQLAIMIAVIIGYSISLYFNIVDTTLITEAAWIQVPSFTLPKFDIGAVLMIVPVVLAVFMEHVGDVTTNGTVVGKNFIEDPGLNRTLLGDGLATMVAGFLGGPANTTYGENTGVLAITKNYNPQILRIAAVFAIFLGVIGKIGGVLRSIPVPVMGGISLMLFTMIAYIGIKNLKDMKVKYTPKNLIIIASILILGLGHNVGLNIALPITDKVALSGLSLAAIIGVLINRVLYHGEFQKK